MVPGSAARDRRLHPEAEKASAPELHALDAACLEHVRAAVQRAAVELDIEARPAAAECRVNERRPERRELVARERDALRGIDEHDRELLTVLVAQRAVRRRAAARRIPALQAQRPPALGREAPAPP